MIEDAELLPRYVSDRLRGEFCTRIRDGKVVRCWFSGGLLAALVGALPAATSVNRSFQGGRVEWTRLITTNKYWDRHSNGDIRFLRLMAANTTLNVAREWHATRAGDLAALCGFPFVYSADISSLTSEEGKNVTEYLSRGGFLFVDACINASINPDPRKFFERQILVLKEHLPRLRVMELPAEHEVFSIYFPMEQCPPMTRRKDSWSGRETFPLRALYNGDRMVGIISLSGFQCGWDGQGGAGEAVEAMKMVVNIYIYAMTR